jgi:hypothetical protein
MVDGQKALIDACEECNVPSYVASDWALDYSKLNLGELFSKDPMIHVKAYLETKKVQGVHILIGGSMEPIFSPFFNIFDPSTDNFRYWGNGDELMEGTTDDNAAEFTAAVALDPKATGIVRFKLPFQVVWLQHLLMSVNSLVVPITRNWHDHLRKSI